MGAKLMFEYDRVGDILYISSCPPYADQESDELAEGVVARMNPESGDIENLEILWFSQRLKADRFELPVIASMRPAD
jgi:hypothetical protein